MNTQRHYPRVNFACRRSGGQAVLMLLCLALLFPPSVLAQVFRGYYSSGELQFKSRKDKHHETIKGYYPGGSLQFIATYHRGRLDGLTKEYYPNGVLKSEIAYERGKRDGLAKFYYENGMLKCKIEYRNDRETGQAKFYDNDGMLAKTIPIERQSLRQRRRAANQNRINTDSTAIPPSPTRPAP
jgi:hypothetical protein